MLEIKNLSFSYKQSNKSLIESLNLKIEQGEILSLLGSSGCGKSSLAKLIAGFENPTQGFIKIDNETVYDSKSSKSVDTSKRNVALVFQDFGLFPFMTVEESIRMWASEGSKALSSHGLLDVLGLKSLLKQKVSTLSGGQKQRVGLARAILANPKLLILDEPLSQLDELAKYKFLEHFREIKPSSMSCLWITHNPRVAIQISQKACYMHSGKLSGPVSSNREDLAALHEDLAGLTKYL